MLPEVLRQRLAAPSAPPRSSGRFVLYWMRAALRAFDNPSLDTALWLAREQRVPAFVYLGLSSAHGHATDRHHTFFLQSAQDVVRQLEARGIGCVVHLERPGDRAPRLLELAAGAVAVVTDAVPLAQHRAWDAAVATAAPLWAVDASCVAPHLAFDARFADLRQLSAAAQPLWDAALSAPWRDEEPGHPPFLPALPFEPVDLGAMAVADLVAACDLDHSVAPVHLAPGGTTAGEARAEVFLAKHLDAFEAERRDPLVHAGHLGNWQRLGCLSPFRLARQVRARGGPGAARYLDELLGWRELAWNFCRFVTDTGHVEALPDWARETLRLHEGDRRDFLPSFEELAHAQTGDPAWDACQRTLMLHGELHPALRVPWAKQLVGWTRTAQDALSMLVALTERYALDSPDPTARFGLLWCLGAGDGAQPDERAWLGRVRSRPVAELLKHPAFPELSRRARHPSRRHALSFAVVGAGVAGAAAARTLADAGHAVTLFEAAAVAGGRLGALDLAGVPVDAGATDFTAQDERFAVRVRAWRHERVLAEWRPRLAVLGEQRLVHPTPGHRFVAAPSMAALVARMLHGLDVRAGTPVAAAEHPDGRWRLRGAGDAALGEYDGLVVATSPADAARLLDGTAWSLAARLRELVAEPAWVVAAAFDAALDLEFDAAEVLVGPLAALTRDDTRPLRPPGERWLLRASAAWSRRHLEETPAAVAAALLDAFTATSGARPATAPRSAARLWPSAGVERPLGEACLFDAALRVAVCGDGCLGRSVEAAFLSGCAAGGRLAGQPDDEDAPPSARKPASQLTLL